MDNNQIQIILEAVNRTQNQLAQVIQQVGHLDRTNARSIATQHQANAVSNAASVAYRNLYVAITAAAAASVLYTRNQLGVIDALSKEARSLEVTTERLSGFKFAMQQSGVSAAESSQQLNFLLRAMQEAAGDRTSKAAQAFKALGISIDGLDRRDVLETTLAISDAYQKHSGAAAKAAIAQDLFGRNSRTTIEFLNDGSRAIRENIDLHGKLGGVVRTLTAAQVERLNDHISSLKTAFQGVTLTLLDNVLPSVTKYSGLLVDLISGHAKLEQQLPLLASGLDVLADAYDSVAGAVSRAFRSFSESALGGAEIEHLKALLSNDDARIKATGQALQDALRRGSQAQESPFISTDFGPAGQTDFLSTDFGAAPGGRGRGVKPQLTNPSDPATLRRNQEFVDKLNLEFLRSQAELLDTRAAKNAAELEEERQRYLKHWQEINDLALMSQGERNALLEIAEKRHQNAMNAIVVRGLQEEMERQHAIARAKKQLRDEEITGYASMAGNLAIIAKTFGREGFAAYKAFAIAEATIAGIKSTIEAFDWGTKFGGPILGAVSAAIAAGAVGAQIATIASTNYAEGGYTGDGARLEPAGTVHRGEVVIPAHEVRARGLSHFAATYFNGRMPGHSGGGFASGGFVSFPTVGIDPNAPGSREQSLVVMFPKDRQDERQAAANYAASITIDKLTRSGKLRR